MRTPSTAVEDLTLAVVPAISCNQPDDVAEVRVLEEYRLFVRFVDGTEGVVDLGALVSSPGAGVFAALREPERFAAVCVSLGAVTWPGEIDLAPDAMYAALRERGCWVL